MTFCWICFFEFRRQNHIRKKEIYSWWTKLSILSLSCSIHETNFNKLLHTHIIAPAQPHCCLSTHKWFFIGYLSGLIWNSVAITLLRDLLIKNESLVTYQASYQIFHDFSFCSFVFKTWFRLQTRDGNHQQRNFFYSCTAAASASFAQIRTFFCCESLGFKCFLFFLKC